MSEDHESSSSVENGRSRVKQPRNRPGSSLSTGTPAKRPKLEEEGNTSAEINNTEPYAADVAASQPMEGWRACKFFDLAGDELPRTLTCFKANKLPITSKLGQFLKLQEEMEEVDLTDCRGEEWYLNHLDSKPKTLAIFRNGGTGLLDPVKRIKCLKIAVNSFNNRFLESVLADIYVGKAIVTFPHSRIWTSCAPILGRLANVEDWDMRHLESFTLEDSWPGTVKSCMTVSDKTLREWLRELIKIQSGWKYSDGIIAMEYGTPMKPEWEERAFAIANQTCWKQPTAEMDEDDSEDEWYELKERAKAFVEVMKMRGINDNDARERNRFTNAGRLASSLVHPLYTTDLVADPGLDPKKHLGDENNDCCTVEASTSGAEVNSGRTPRAIWDMTNCWPLLAPVGLPNKGEGVNVCVIDNGFDLTNPQFDSANIVAVRGFRKDVEDVSDLCSYSDGHGTTCTAIIAGKDCGIAPNVRLYLASVGASCQGIAEAVKWACDQQVDVISISMSSEVYNHNMAAQIRTALSCNIVIVATANNYGKGERMPIRYPARLGGLLCIGSHDNKGLPSRFSSIGRELDFLAPGSDVHTTKGGSVNGTSLAAPFVAALSALLIQLLKSMSIDNRGIEVIRAILQEMATHRGSHHTESGYGLLEVHRFLKILNRDKGHLLRVLDAAGLKEPPKQTGAFNLYTSIP